MTITNTWSVVQMNAYPEYEGEQDIVFAVHWTLSATDGTYQGSVYGSIGITLTEASTFIPYADLTEAQVIGWVHNEMGEGQVASYELNVANQINDQVKPIVITPPLPWSA